MFSSHIQVGAYRIGRDCPVFIIAEAGVNHNGDLKMAKALIREAKACGVDCVKFQTFEAERLVTRRAPKAEYQRQATDPSESQWEMLRRLELSREAHQEIMVYCQEASILFLSTPFDENGADFLVQERMDAIKVPSGEITNLPFLAYLARKKRPMLVSTGMARLGEVEDALRAIYDEHNHEVVLLHCVSNYPADPADANLRAIQTMANAFHVPVGYSDHTTGLAVPLAAVALGACIIEKHFTLDKALPGPDHRMSLNSNELAAMVRGIRTVEVALGHGRKVPAASETSTALVARRSLVAARTIQPGEVLADEMIAVKRPGSGFSPSLRTMLVGRRARVAIDEGALFDLEMFE